LSSSNIALLGFLMPRSYSEKALTPTVKQGRRLGLLQAQPFAGRPHEGGKLRVNTLHGRHYLTTVTIRVFRGKELAFTASIAVPTGHRRNVMRRLTAVLLLWRWKLIAARVKFRALAPALRTLSRKE
jgi:hypothetical protein